VWLEPRPEGHTPGAALATPTLPSHRRPRRLVAVATAATAAALFAAVIAAPLAAVVVAAAAAIAAAIATAALPSCASWLCCPRHLGPSRPPRNVALILGCALACAHARAGSGGFCRRSALLVVVS